MEAQEYRIIAPKNIQGFAEKLEKPKEREYLIEVTDTQVCDADAKYYFGLRPALYRLFGFKYLYGVRDKKKFMQKYPLTPIHEAIGVILASGPDARYVPKTRVVLIPSIACKDPGCRYCTKGLENCCPNSRFMSSDMPGFARTHIILPEACVAEIPGEVADEVAVYAEITTVAYGGILAAAIGEGFRVGVYGDGYLGFILAALLSRHFKVSKENLFVFGVHDDKLSRCSDFATTLNLRKEPMPEGLELDAAFECVGKRNAEKVIDQAITAVKPMGVIVLLGVSEEKVPINTRDVLSKSLTIKGVSRSPASHYKVVLDAMRDKELQKLYSRIKGPTMNIRSEEDMKQAFERFMVDREKVLMKW